MVQRHGDDAIPDIVGNAVPDTRRRARPVLQAFDAVGHETIIPTVEGRPWNAELVECLPGRKVRLLNDPDDLKLLGGGISHSSSPPSAIMLFLSRRFSRVRSASASFRSRLSRRSAFTSSLVAERAVSPASRFLPASRNSFDQL